MMDALRSLVANGRQLLYPPEFRIGRPVLSVDVLGALEALRQPPTASGPVERDEPPAVDATIDKTLAELATTLWRQRKTMVEDGTDRPLEAMRRPYRHLQSGLDVLADAGVSIRDHTDQPFPKGGVLGLQVVSRETRAEFTRPRIIETVTPTVLRGDRVIQRGQVIVGMPSLPDAGAGSE
jgi:hypothetical protein